MSGKVQTGEAPISWDLLEGALNELCAAHGEGRFLPLLEADVAGYLYHILVARFGGDARQIHLDTRLYRANEKQKYDLVLGPVVTTEAQKQVVLKRAGDQLSPDQKRLLVSKRLLRGFRPAVSGKLILELKLFAHGFTHEQHAEHFRQAVGDIEHLGTLAKHYPGARAAVLFDDDGYLSRERQEKLIKVRAADDPALRIYVCQRPKGGGTLSWQLL